MDTLLCVVYQTWRPIIKVHIISSFHIVAVGWGFGVSLIFLDSFQHASGDSLWEILGASAKKDSKVMLVSAPIAMCADRENWETCKILLELQVTYFFPPPIYLG